MASLGDMVVRKTNEAITVKFGLLDNGAFVGSKSPTVTIYDEADSSFSTPTVSEPITGVYEFTFTPDAAGQWSAKMVESTIPAAYAWSWDVVTTVSGDRIPDTLSLANIQAEAEDALEAYRLDELLSANLGSNPATNSLFDILFNADSNKRFDRRFCSLEALGSLLCALPNGLDFTQLTAATGSTSTVVKTTANEADDYYNGLELIVVPAAGGGSAIRRITDYANTDGAFTLDSALPFTPANGDVCYVRLAHNRTIPGDDMALETDAVDADAVATDAVAEIQSGLATSAEVSAVETDTQDIQSRLPAALVGGRMDSNVGAVSGDTTAADNLEADYDGTGYNKSASEIGTVATLTGHTPQTGDSFARLGAPAGASVSADIATVDANVDTLLTRITSSLFNGITSLAEWLGALAGKQSADATARTEIRGTGAGSGTYDETTDSQEAISDSGGGGLTSQEVRDAMKLAPTGGAPAAGSVDQHLDDIETDTTAIETDTQDIQGRLPAALVGGRIDADVGAVSGDATAADNLEADYDGTGYNKSASEIGTAATLTGHTPQTGDSYARLGAPAGASVSADIATVDTNVDTLLTRITATLFSGITSLAEWLGLLAGKQNADATALSEVRGTGAGSGTYDPNDDALEAIRDRGDAAWVTGSGGTPLTAQETRDAMKLAPTGGAPAAGSVDAHLDTIEEDTAAMQPTIATNLDATIGSIASAIAALNDPSAAAVADAVWDELQSGHTDAGSFAEFIKLILQHLENKLITDPSTGVATLYDDDSTTPLKTSQHYEDAAGDQTYRGQGAERRERYA